MQLAALNPDLSAAWLAERLVRHDATKPSRSGAGKSFGLAHDFCSQSMERKSLSALYCCSDFGTSTSIVNRPADRDL